MFEKYKDIKNIAIYGTGIASKILLVYLQEKYPYIRIKTYVDLNALSKKEIDGIPVVTIEHFIENNVDIDLLINTLPHNKDDIERTFRALGYTNILTISGNDFANNLVTDLFDNINEKELFNQSLKARFYKNIKSFENYIISAGLTIDTNYATDSRQYLEFVNKNAIKTVFDCGGLNAYTSIVFEQEFHNAENIFCFEPLYKRFKNFIAGSQTPQVIFENIVKNSKKINIVEKGVWNEDKTDLTIYECVEQRGCSTLIQQCNNENFTTNTIEVVTIDKFKKDNNIHKIDFIKMDIEGAELNALKGAEKTIIADRPQLAISIYHSTLEMFLIPLYLKSICQDYVFHIGHYSLGIGETVFYAIPKELV